MDTSNEVGYQEKREAGSTTRMLQTRPTEERNAQWNGKETLTGGNTQAPEGSLTILILRPLTHRSLNGPNAVCMQVIKDGGAKS
jgi:hypothetical protein